MGHLPILGTTQQHGGAEGLCGGVAVPSEAGDQQDGCSDGQEHLPRRRSQCLLPWENILSKKFELKKKKPKHEPLTWLGVASIFAVPLVPPPIVGEQTVAPWGQFLKQ
jgi:hypothetical protein